MTNGRYQSGWIIRVLSRDEEGFIFELADLGNGKHMIVATDTSNPITKDCYRQGGFGPFVIEQDATFDEQIKVLKSDLLDRRTKALYY